MDVIEYQEVCVKKMQKRTLDYLGPYAERYGYGTKRAAVLRFAAIELERRLRREAELGPGSVASC